MRSADQLFEQAGKVAGYPECVVKQGNGVTYREIKTSASVQKGSTRYLKSFSFSSGKKIKWDARHLLLEEQLEEEDNRVWKVVACEMRYLSTEFNVRFSDLVGVRLFGSSDAVG